MVDIIVRVVYQGTTYDLDIDSDIPLRLDISSVENQAIGKFFGVGSQTFDLPGTKTNNQFFKHGYTVGANEIPGFYNSITGYIIFNGETILQGQFQLLEVVTDDKGYTTYKCRITDQVVTFNDALSDRLIKNANWSDLDHTLTYANITGSWDNQLLSGSVFYPLAFYGFDNPDNIQLPYFSFSGSVGAYLTNIFTPIQANMLIPAVRVKDTLDKIFEQAGFDYTGSFVTGSDFENLYILPKAQDKSGVVAQPGTTPTCYVTMDTNQTITTGSWHIVQFDSKISDPQVAFDDVNFKYDISSVGDYTFSSTISFFNPAWLSGKAKIEMRLMVGTSGSSGTVLSSATREFGPGDGFNTYSLNVGSTSFVSSGPDVWVEVQQTNLSGSPSNLGIFAFSNFQCTSAPAAVVGATVDMGLQFGGNTKSIDILNGLIEQFNLVLTPVKGRDRLISIDTFDTWIRAGRKKDWTDKYNTATRIGINHTVDEQPKELLLKNVDDIDRFSKAAIDSDPNYQYGTLRLLADSNVSQGKRNIGSFFAPVVLGGPFDPDTTGIGTSGDGTLQIDYSNTFVFPHLYKYENSKTTPYTFKPRLGYKVTNTLPDTIYIGATGGAADALTGSYATLSNLNELPATATSKNLLFNNTYSPFSSTNNLLTGSSNYELYWKTYLDSLYWEDSTKVTIDLEFSQYEYQTIDLNDRIFIKDTFYRINKITGYNLSYKDIATVELIKLYPAYFEGINFEGCVFTVSASAADTDCIGNTPTPTPTYLVATPTPTATAIVAPTPTPTGPTPTPTSSPTATPTPSPTATGPTPTPTTSPTPTPTAAGVVYTLEISSGSTNQYSCGNTFTGSVYTSVSMSAWTAYGQYIYQYPDLSGPFNGGNNFFRIKSGSNDEVWSVNSLGLVSVAGPNCAGLYQFYGNAGFLTEGDECFEPVTTDYYTTDFTSVTNMQVGDRIYADSSLTYQLNDGYYYGVSDSGSGYPSYAFEYSLISGVTNIGNCSAGIPISMSSYGLTSTEACQDTTPQYLAFVSQSDDPFNLQYGDIVYSNPQLTSPFTVANNVYWGVYSGSLSTPYVWYKLANGVVIDSGSCGFANAYSASVDNGSTIGGEGCYNDMPNTIYMRKPLAEIVASGSGRFYSNEFASVWFAGNSGKYSMYQSASTEYSESRAIFTIQSQGIGTLVEECGTRYTFYGKGHLTEGNECIEAANTTFYTMDFTTVADVQNGDRIYANAELSTELNDGYYYGITDTSGSTPEKGFMYSLISGVTNLGSCDAGLPVSMSSYGLTPSEACQDATWQYTAYISKSLDPLYMNVGDRFYSNPQLTEGFGFNNVYYGVYVSGSTYPHAVYGLSGTDPNNGYVASSGSCGVDNAYSASRDAGSTIGGEGCFNDMPYTIYMRKPLAEIVASGSGYFYSNDIASVLYTGASGVYSLHQSASATYSESRALFTINTFTENPGYGYLSATCSLVNNSFFGTTQQNLNVDPCSAGLTQTYYTSDFNDVANIQNGDRIYTNAAQSNELADNHLYAISNTSGSSARYTGGVSFHYSLISGVNNIVFCSVTSSLWNGTSPVTGDPCIYTMPLAYYTSGSVAISDLVGEKLYQDASASLEITADNKWIGLGFDPSPASPDVRVFYVSGSGITQLSFCGTPFPTPTPTPTSTGPTPTPSSTPTPTPTISPTPTPTPTPSSTPTPTPTPTDTVYALNKTTPGTFSGLGCAKTATDGDFYTTRSRGLNIQVGDIMYADGNLQTVYNGGNSYYGVATANDTTPEVEIRVNAGGQVTYVAACPAPPTPTPTPTATPVPVQNYRSNSGYGNTASACSDTTLNAIYAIADAASLQVNDYIYTNSAMTIPFNGGGQYWGIESGTTSYRAAMLIASDGRIQLKSTCP